MQQSGYNIRTIQELLGYWNVEITHDLFNVIKQGGKGVRSPADLYFMLLKGATYAKKEKCVI